MVKKICLSFVILGFLALGLTSFLRMQNTESLPDSNDSVISSVVETPKKEEETEEKPNFMLTNNFELPINGASGYASIALDLLADPRSDANIIKTLKAGQGFTIVFEIGEYWYIKVDNTFGFVPYKNCMINLPDVLPSIIYNITNSEASIMRSLGKDIENITDEQLYDVYFYNKRLQKYEYTVPVLYNMAKKIAVVQKNALLNNESLVIYEGFRPYEVQRKVVENVKALASVDEEVLAGLTTAPWGMSWFISTGTSNHQKGLAIDTSLAKVITYEEKTLDGYTYKVPKTYQEYTMPTPMHELSMLSVRFTTPVSSKSPTAWLKASLTLGMKNNIHAQDLQNYCTNAGLTPLASEWWHFNDLDSLSLENGNGRFYITNVYSTDLKSISTLK